MLVANPKHREKTEKIWNLPAGTLNPKVGADLMAILRGVEDKSIDFLWTQVVNIIQSAPNNTHWIEACRRPDAFVVVSDIYPTFSARCADLILPVAGHFEKWASTATPNAVLKLAPVGSGAWGSSYWMSGR